MRYLVQHADSRATDNSGWFDGEVIVDGAQCVPRIGETLELDEIQYTVAHVFHVARARPPIVVDGAHVPASSAGDIVVRVK